MAGLDLDTVLGGALGYLQSALGIDSPAGGGGGSAWQDYLGQTMPQLAGLSSAAAEGGTGRSSFPALAGGGGGASGFPQLAGGAGGPSNFPVLAGSAGGVSSFPVLGGAGNYLSQLAGQATSAAQGAYNYAHPPARDTRGTPQPGPAPSAAPGAGGSGSGGADDNAGLTGAQIDTWLTSTRPNAPIAGLGQYILDTANKYGVSAPLMLGIALKESELGTTAGPGKILTGITDPALDQGLGQTRAFEGFSTWQEAIDATARNLSSGLYKGKPLEQQVGTWYVGPQAFAAGGLDATDQAGNGTVRDYVNMVRQVYGQLGVGAAAAPRQPGRVTAQGYAFPVVGFRGPVQLHWGQEQGGSDLMAPEGSPVVALGGGTVVDASPNTLGGNTVTLRLDNGLLVYMAHLRDAPLVRAGQRVNAGQQLGYVGSTGNAAGGPPHLHIGIGNDIVSGSGPTGGLGSGGFNAVDWLNQILQQGGG